MTMLHTPHLVGRLESLGFKPAAGGRRRKGMTARFEPRWLTFYAKAATERRSPGAAHGAPGLWKVVVSPTGRAERVFDLPLAVIADGEICDPQTGECVCPINRMVEWVSAAKLGNLPTGWTCPPRESLDESLPRGAMTIQVGRFARQGQLHCEESRLSVSIPLLSRLPANLAPARRSRLDQLLADVQHRTRLMRFIETETDEGMRNIVAEADLSGAPHFAMPQLMRFGLEAVRHAVSQSIVAVELLVDPTVTSTVWEIP